MRVVVLVSMNVRTGKLDARVFATLDLAVQFRDAWQAEIAKGLWTDPMQFELVRETVRTEGGR